MDLKIINSVTFSPEIAKSLKRRAKQQTMTSLVFRHYLLSFFFAKAECTSVPKDFTVWTVIVGKRMEKITNKLDKLFRCQSLIYTIVYKLLCGTKGINIEIDLFEIFLVVSNLL